MWRQNNVQLLYCKDQKWRKSLSVCIRCCWVRSITIHHIICPEPEPQQNIDLFTSSPNTSGSSLQSGGSGCMFPEYSLSLVGQPTCATLRKHFTKPLSHLDTPQCIQLEFGANGLVSLMPTFWLIQCRLFLQNSSSCKWIWPCRHVAHDEPITSSLSVYLNWAAGPTDPNEAWG